MYIPAVPWICTESLHPIKQLLQVAQSNLNPVCLIAINNACD